jgi:hypothetical protein
MILGFSKLYMYYVGTYERLHLIYISSPFKTAIHELFHC